MLNTVYHMSITHMAVPGGHLIKGYLPGSFSAGIIHNYYPPEEGLVTRLTPAHLI